MIRLAVVALVCAASPLLLLQGGAGKVRVGDGARYEADGRLTYPETYREWVFLSSGLDMSYDSKAQNMGAGMFNNVFVNPEAYRGYQATGHWPEGTVMVLENRGAALGSAHQPLLKQGKVQTTEEMGMEVHVLDSAHAGGDGWAFYGFEGKAPAKAIARPASCYTCHEQHAAVDTTFVQFYPTLMEAAMKNKSLSAAYLKEIAAK